MSGKKRHDIGDQRISDAVVHIASNTWRSLSPWPHCRGLLPCARSSSYYFSCVFRKVAGVSPREFERANR